MSYLLRCDRTWPDTGTLELGIEDGVLVPPGRVDDPRVLDFSGDTIVVTPGWINAHCHLELSGVSSIDYTGNFLDWIYDVLDYKQSTSRETIVEEYRDGAHELATSGVTRVVDHCDLEAAVLDELDDFDLAVHLMKELIAFSQDQIEILKEEAADFLERLEQSEATGGLAPHAPYSAHPDVYRWAADKIKDHDLSLSTHLHEIQAELEFAQENDGEFVELLRERTSSRVESPYKGSRPLPHLVNAGVFSKSSFGVHLNYLNDEDRRWLEASNICPVFCPRSYSYFNHQTLPVSDWLDEGLSFAFGTDSRASNDRLNMLDELKCLAGLVDSIDPESVLEALTINPAEVLNIPSRGVLTWGTPADLSVFNVPSGELADLSAGRAEAVATFVDGEPVWRRSA